MRALSIFVSVFMMFAASVNANTAEQNEATKDAYAELVHYFFAAARTGNTEVLQEFLSAGFPVNTRNTDSYTALMTATYYGHANAVDMLLAHGADACLRDKRDNTAMMGAIVKAEWSIARTLYRIDCDKQTAQAGMKTVEEFAEMFGQADKFEQLKQELGATKG